MSRTPSRTRRALLLLSGALLLPALAAAQQPQDSARRPAPPRMPEDPRTAPTQKPALHAQHWLAITGKPLAATAGALTFARGGNAVDAAVAMLAATCTMWDTLSCGGETQALIYDPHAKRVIGINALGVAPTGATAEFYRAQGHRFPPEYGPLAAVTPGTPGGMLTMLAEYGKLSLEQVLAPAIALADGYPIEAQLASTIERQREWLEQWRYSRAVMLPHLGTGERAAPRPGEIFVQSDLAATFRKLVEAERQALAAGKDRKAAIAAAYDRFYRGDIAQELVRGAREEGALLTLEDLANWEVKIEEPVRTTYRGIEVYKLPFWQQGPAMLQALNILENVDLKALGYNSPRYLHALYQAMSLAFADRDFYYGDPYFPPEEPVQGLLSKEYAKARSAQIDWARNDRAAKPGDPYPFQGGTNPFRALLESWDPARFLPADTSVQSGGQDRTPPPDTAARPPARDTTRMQDGLDPADDEAAFYRGTTSVVSADAEGWVVSITPSGGWVPAVIAGRTGIGLSQRAQSFVTAPEDGPYNVIAPGKRPRVTLTPTIALKDGSPFLAFAVQGGDSQDQNLLQFFLNIVEFGMNVQQAAEAPNMNSFQMRSSFGAHETRPGHMLVATSLPEATRAALRDLGYLLRYGSRTSGPINAIFFDRANGTLWGGSSNHGEDYGIGW